MGWWITLGILFLLAILPLGVHVHYDADGIRIRIVLGKIRITVFPVPRWMKKKKTGEKTEKPPEKKKEKKKKPAESAGEKKGGSFTDFLPLVRVGLNFLGDFRRKLRVNYLQLRLVMAGGDPCNLAVSYGRAWAALGNLQPQLERIFVIKKRDLNIACDFTASQTLITATLEITITLGRLIGLLVVYGIRILKELLKIKKKRKGGAAK